MAALLKRYLAGEHEAVWKELGTGKLSSARLVVAEAVAQETMRRVRRNLDALVERLRAEGFRFENPLAPEGADADARYFCVRALPTRSTGRLIHRVERLAGALPLSVKAFYRQVGAVNLLGGLDSTLTTADDPLMVAPLEHLPAEWDEWSENAGDQRKEDPFAWEFAPDGLHKDNVSGGLPFRVLLPAGGADGVVDEENWGPTPFVSYLRTTLKWAGFPGLRKRTGLDRQEALVQKLTEGLEPF